MAMPKGNMFWRDIPTSAIVREHPTYFEVVDGKKRYVANWSSQDAREAQAALKRRAASRSHATKKSPGQLDREIADALSPHQGRWDDSPGAWQRGYDFAKESALHETRAEQREILRRVSAGARSAYDQGFVAGYQDVLGVPRARSRATRKDGRTDGGPRVLKVSRGKTFAGQRSITAEVQYPDEEPSRVEFVGPSGGGSGPVVMIYGEKRNQTFVSDPSRFGDFGPDWVRRFFDAA